MAEGLGLRRIPSSSAEDIELSKPVPNEVMLTDDEGRILTSQVNVANAPSPLRSLPFSDEVFLLSSADEAGLTTFATEQKIEPEGVTENPWFGVSSAISGDGSKAVVGMSTKGTDNQGAIALMSLDDGLMTLDGYLTPTSSPSNDRFGTGLAASEDLSVIAATRFGNLGFVVFKNNAVYDEISLSADPEAVCVTDDGQWVFVGMPRHSSYTGEVVVYRDSGTSFELVQRIAGDNLGDEFGASISFGTTAQGDFILAIGARGGYVRLLRYESNQFAPIQDYSYTGLPMAIDFGHSVALTRDASRLYVGAPKYSYFGSPMVTECGAVAVAARQETGLYADSALIELKEAGNYASLGHSIEVSRSGSVVFVAAPNSSMKSSGGGVILALDDKHQQLGVLFSASTASGDGFGGSIALSSRGDVALAGAHRSSGGKGYVSSFLTKSKWRKALPETDFAAFEAESVRQGTISGKDLMKAIQDRIGKIKVVTDSDIYSALPAAGLISGRLLREKFDEIKVLASGKSTNLTAPELDYSPESLTAVDKTSNTLLVDGATMAVSASMAGSFVGDFSIEVTSERLGDSDAESSIIFKVDGFPLDNSPTEEGFVLSFQHAGTTGAVTHSCNLFSLQPDPEGTFSGSLWENLSESESIIVSVTWANPSGVMIVFYRQNGEKIVKALSLTKPVMTPSFQLHAAVRGTASEGPQ